MSHFERTPVAVELLLQEYFDLFAFARTTEWLRMANQIAGRALFRWSTRSRDSAPVRASNGMRVTPDGALQTAPTADLLILCDATGSRPADRSGRGSQRRTMPPAGLAVRDSPRTGVAHPA